MIKGEKKLDNKRTSQVMLKNEKNSSLNNISPYLVVGGGLEQKFVLKGTEKKRSNSDPRKFLVIGDTFKQQDAFNKSVY